MDKNIYIFLEETNKVVDKINIKHYALYNDVKEGNITRNEDLINHLILSLIHI